MTLPGSLKYSKFGEELWLLSQKAIFWPDEQCLFISDVHLGKTQHFRKFGLGIPSGISEDNFNRLSKVIAACCAKKVIFLGDLFHSSLNTEWEMFSKFRDKYSSVRFELVKGNHDILDEKLFLRALDKILPEGSCLGPFALFHHPTTLQGKYSLCGHVHPSLKIISGSKQSVRLPCFYFGSSYAILPAFGSFTGTYSIKPKESDDIYVIAEDEVLRY